VMRSLIVDDNGEHRLTGEHSKSSSSGEHRLTGEHLKSSWSEASGEQSSSSGTSGERSVTKRASKTARRAITDLHRVARQRSDQ
jgi:hypothetical protein